ncbi:MAG: ATP-grasp domain-containing protein [Chloroflexi bacterium]|nr:ATP-grasp domain-containing protein [Chloroflexota bacterium]
MRIGLAYDLKEAVAREHGGPEDALAEYDCAETLGYLREAIEADGHTVVTLGGGRQMLENILARPVDFVFNIAEGRGTWRSREAQVPGLLEMLDIPYSGSDPLTLAACLDKALTKQIVSLAGVATPAWTQVSTTGQLERTDWASLPFPAIVKPVWEGSSKGIKLTSLADNPEQAAALARDILTEYRQPAIIEQFIAGDELTVGVVGNAPPEVIGVMRILPRQPSERFVYSIEVKRDWRALVEYECPARLPQAILDRVAGSSLAAFRALGCRDFARIDFRLGAGGRPYFLEINPLPGLGDYSDLVIMAVKAGWSHRALIQAVLRAALGRYPVCARK